MDFYPEFGEKTNWYSGLAKSNIGYGPRTPVAQAHTS
jgi:hypothetical protein